MAVLPTGIGPVTGGYQIERSLRFNSADTAYLNRTLTTPTNNKIWTWSSWVKKSFVTSDKYLVTANGTTAYEFIKLSNSSSDNFEYAYWNGSAFAYQIRSTLVLRDPSAWYHIVVSVDTTQATAANRVKLYVNNVEITSFSISSYPAQNTNTQINSAIATRIGGGFAGNYFDGYMTEVNFIDGQALTPSSFGETDSNTGVWKPKKYTGTYGTNGFYLKFADNSGTTSTTLGKDSSGNGNNWTPNNFSVTAGAGNDSLVDSPTSYGTDTGVGGTVRGNYCTWSPIDIPDPSTNSYTLTLSNGNLDTATGGSEGFVNNTTLATFQIPTTGKWYWEILVTNVATASSTRSAIGIMNQAAKYADGSDFAYADVSGVYAYAGNGQKVTSPNLTLANYGNSYTNNNVIGVAVDSDAGKIWFAKNGTWQNSGSPTGGTNEAFSGLVMSQGFQPAIGYWLGCTANFGQRAFAYTAPSGFKALCTTNLPTPTIGATSTTQANDYFNAKLYTGNGSTQSITGVGFQPDWVWVKSRSSSGQHSLTDAVRGVNKQLFTSLTDAEGSQTDQVTAFNSDGFSLGANAAGTGSVNVNTLTYVAWNWKANGAGSSNTAGTITSTVSANTTSGFSIVTYTGNGSSGATIGHGLGVAPSMVIIKCRSNGASNWPVYHSAIAPNNSVWLSLTNGSTASSSNFNNTATTSTLVTLGNDTNVNGSTRTYVAYCFAAVAGYSAFGSYTGNGVADGPFVYLGFRPRYVMIKSSSNVTNWFVIDTARDTYNQSGSVLWPNLANSEDNGGADVSPMDFLSNGFKMRSASADTNINNYTYIYACFAENPFKYSLAR